jgi:hypothetical protein
MFSLSGSRPDQTRPQLQVDDRLFIWRGGGVVLFGEARSGRWIVSRGWIGPDCLTDIRRWTFTTPAGFGGQFRRLAREASAHPTSAQALGAAATRWATDSQ